MLIPKILDLNGENAHTVLRIGELAMKNIQSTKAKSCFGLPCSLSPRTTTNQEILLIIGRLGLIFDVKVRKMKVLDVDKTRPSSDSEAPTFNEQTIQSVDESTMP